MVQINIFKKTNVVQVFQAILFTILLSGCNGSNLSKFDDIRRIDTYKNAILMIGDGMGSNQVKVTEVYNGESTFISSEAEVTGWVKTSSLNSAVTDSAAAATAMSTAQKVPNGKIATKNGSRLTTMAEFAKARQMGVGIIATETLTGATPAAFSSHSETRSATDLIAQDQFASDVDLFMGAGKSYYDAKIESMRDARLTYYTNFEVLSNDITNVQSRPVFSRYFASFDTISVTTSTSSSPTLADMSLEAINYLDNAYKEKGFFMMIEGSHIDKRAHDNDLEGMINQVNGFDQAVAAVVDWARNDKDTFVMVTADHETGGLTYDGESRNELNNDMFTTTGHTGVNVPFYVYNVEKLSFFEQDEVIDNTDIAKFYQALIRKE